MRTFALAGALLLGAAAVPSVADAAIIVSQAGKSFTGTGIASGNTVAVNAPLGPWTANGSAGPGAVWVSYNADTNPGGPVDAPAGAKMSITETFNAIAGSLISLRVWADDTASVVLNGTTLIDFNGVTDGTCAGPDPIGCEFGEGFIDATLTALAFNTVTIVARQDNGDAFGMQYGIEYTVPLPGAVLLFGSALAGLGVMRRRRKSETVPAAA